MAETMVTKWIIDSDHSTASFAIKHLMLASVRGIINQVTGTIYCDPTDLTSMEMYVEMDVSSINTGVSKRDDHLKTGDFFDVARYPKMTFKSTGAESLGNRHIRIVGDLSLHGVTRRVAIEGEYSGPVKVPESLGGETSIGFTGSARLNREDFGMTWGSISMIGGLALDREVLVTIDIEADMAEHE